MFYLVITWIAAPLLYLRLMLRAKRNPEHCHILVIQTAKIGDMICSTPIFREIKRNRPTSKLTVLCSPLTEPLLEHNPYVDAVRVVDTKTLSGLRGKFRFIKLLSSENADISICLSPNLAFLIAPFWAGVTTRVSVFPNYFGATYLLAKAFLSFAVRHRQGRLFADTALILLETLGFEVRARNKEVYWVESAVDKVRTLLNHVEIKGNLIGIGISSGNKLKALPLETIRKLIQLILSETDSTVLLVGASSDLRIGETLSSIFSSPRVLNFAGALTLQELPILIRQLTLYVGVDSGITYLADALNTPLIDIMGPADPEDQRPTGTNAQIIKTELPCAPCSHAFRSPYDCSIGTRACVVGLQAEHIFKCISHFFDTVRSNSAHTNKLL